MNNGMLIVVSAPSGCGKDTILDLAIKQNNNLYYSVSATSREIRTGEVNGVNYHFYTRDKFEKLIKSGFVLEYTEYCGNYYGTPKAAVDEMLSAGKDVVLKIEVEGAMNVKKLNPDAVLIFIMPPSIFELERRLRKRGSESEEQLLKRLETAGKEIEYADKYDFIIINDDLDKAVNDFLSIIACEKLTVKRNIDFLRGF